MLGFLGGDYSFFAHATDTRPTRDRHAIRVKVPKTCRGGVGRSRKRGLGGFGSEEPRRAGRGPGAGEDRGTRGRIEELGGGSRNSARHPSPAKCWALRRGRFPVSSI